MTRDKNKQTNESQESNWVLEFLTPSFKVKDKYKEIKKKQGRKPINKWLKIVTGFLILTTIIVLFISSYVSKEVEKLEQSRDKQLDIYETTKFAILDDITSYLTIQTKEDYIEAKSTVNIIDWYKEQIFGESYNSDSFYGATHVNAVDIQYSLEDEKGVTKYYLMLNVTKGDITKQIEMLISVHNYQIFNILVI